MKQFPRLRLTKISLRDAAAAGLPALVLALIAFRVAYQFVKPAPPDSFVMTTGREDSGYHAFGKRYQEILARYGIKVELLPSAGSVENLSRLADEDSEVEAGFATRRTTRT